MSGLSAKSSVRRIRNPTSSLTLCTPRNHLSLVLSHLTRRVGSEHPLHANTFSHRATAFTFDLLPFTSTLNLPSILLPERRLTLDESTYTGFYTLHPTPSRNTHPSFLHILSYFPFPQHATMSNYKQKPYTAEEKKKAIEQFSEKIQYSPRYSGEYRVSAWPLPALAQS